MHMSPYEDEDDAAVNRAYERDTGAVPFAARACEACNAAGARVEVMADSLASYSESTMPAMTDMGRSALVETERAGVAASGAVSSAIVGDGTSQKLQRLVCEGTLQVDRACVAALPAIQSMEAAVLPHISKLETVLRKVDEARAAENAVRSFEHVFGLIQVMSAKVEDGMLQVSTSLGLHLAIISKWGDRRMGIQHRQAM
jgi:hypothetical protein